MFSAENNEVRGLKFVEALGMGRGVTAVIGSGGKSSLLNRLAMELRGGGGVILCTTTHMFPLRQQCVRLFRRMLGPQRGRSERMGRSALASLWMMGGCALLP